ncbi:hypothetical protein ACOTI4_14520, partial [Achromobacter xylosoxidans]
CGALFYWFSGWLLAGGMGFVGRPARVVAGGARLRLRSGAFAPDCPVLNLVAACRRLPSVSAGRI